MSLTPETLALAEELSEMCMQRGYDLALTDALGEEQRQILTALDELTTRLDMNDRILACLQEHQEHLLAHGFPEEDWTRFRIAFAAYTRRCQETRAQASLLSRLSYRLLRKLVTLARQGVI